MLQQRQNPGIIPFVLYSTYLPIAGGKDYNAGESGRKREWERESGSKRESEREVLGERRGLPLILLVVIGVSQTSHWAVGVIASGRPVTWVRGEESAMPLFVADTTCLPVWHCTACLHSQAWETGR